MELEPVDGLWRGLAGVRGRACDQILQRAGESVEAGRIGTIAQVDAQGTDRCAVANSEADRMHHVIEVRVILLAKAKTHRTDIRIDVSHIVKQYAADVFANQRETQLGGVKQHGGASQRETGFEIPRSRLVIGKGPLLGGAAGEQTLGERDLRQSADPLDVAE